MSTIFFTLSLPGGPIILIGSGFFFGFILGFIINILSVTLGCFIFIVFSKTLLSKLFNKIYYKFSQKLSKFVGDSSYEYLILVRLIIGIPLAVQNICISMLNISKVKIFFTTFIGFTPLMLLFAYFGSYVSDIIQLKSIGLKQIFSLEIFFIFASIVFLILLRIFLRK
jgi:uncharacterized membrane protein YdjX (TVP38/TMEM64 family)